MSFILITISTTTIATKELLDLTPSPHQIIQTFLYLRKGILRRMYIKIGLVKSFYLYFFGWGLRVIYHSDIFENLDHPLGFQKSQIEIGTFLVFFLPLPTLLFYRFFSDGSPY